MVYVSTQDNKAVKKVWPYTKGQVKKIVKYRWRSRNGCDGK